MQRAQLTLFGKRQRAPRAAPEFNLHVLIANILRRWGSKGWDWTHLPFGEYRGDPERARITGARLKRMGAGKGWPDFMFFAPAIDDCTPGCVYFLELKRKGGRLTDEQKALMQSLRMKGHRYGVADNFDDAIAILKTWGAVRVSVSA
jgi:hypothetical protein